MFLSLIVALFFLLSSYNLEVYGWLLAITGSILLVLARSSELSLPAGMVRILVAPVLLLCVGLHGVYRNPLFDFGKDVWYFSGPIVYVAFGYLVFERLKRWQKLIQPLVIIGAYSCAATIFGVYANRSHLLATTTVEDYRHQIAGLGTFVLGLPTVVLALMQHTGLHTEGITRRKVARFAIYALSVLAVLTTFSRTHMICLVAGLAGTFDLHFNLRRFRNYIGYLFAACVLAGMLFGFVHAGKDNALLDTFGEKLLNTSSEVEVHNYETYQDINLNWRGFEAAKAKETFARFGDMEKIFGGGFGTPVNLGFAMKLLTEFMQFVPLLHNGYMELLVKTGLLGLCLFLAFCIQIAFMAVQQFRKPGRLAKLNGFLLLWTVFVFAFTQAVITGILNKGELAPSLFLLGATCASVSLSSRHGPPVKEPLTVGR